MPKLEVSKHGCQGSGWGDIILKNYSSFHGNETFKEGRAVVEKEKDRQMQR